MQLIDCHGEPTQMPTAERRTVSNRVSLGPATRGVWHLLTLAAESFTGPNVSMLIQTDRDHLLGPIMMLSGKTYCKCTGRAEQLPALWDC